MTYTHDDLILPSLNLPCPCPITLEIDLQRKRVYLHVGPRDWEWEFGANRLIGCGTSLQESEVEDVNG